VDLSEPPGEDSIVSRKTGDDTTGDTIRVSGRDGETRSCPRDTFGSRLGLMLVMLGMAVGTGNIWRFPRIVAQNGGGEFLIPWVTFLFLWSIPLLLVEFGMGRQWRSGPVAAFARMMGPGYAWMGAFVAFVATAILFYYSVVTGWTFRYVLATLLGELPEARPGAFWAEFTRSWWPVVAHGAAVLLGTLVVVRGIQAIERLAKVLVPTLIVLVVALALHAARLPGASAGMAFLFGVDWGRLLEARLWIEALTQNAWDTGAGWGLALCYAAYLRERDDTALNAFLVPIANNAVSLLAGIAVLCTVFSVVPRLAIEAATDPEALAAFPGLSTAIAGGSAVTPELLQRTIFGAGNEGMTFIWIPQLLGTLPFGRLLMLLFFVALSLAAMTSLIAMLELLSRVLVDFGLARRRAVLWAGTAAFLLGVPSALSLRVLKNQDWVWGVGLLLSGLFFAIAILRHGARRFREAQLNHPHSDIRIGAWWDVVIGLLVPVEALALLGWWLFQAWSWDPDGWLDPLAQENVGTVLAQFGIVLVALLAANRWMAHRCLASGGAPSSSGD
jgi:NSS family neurotransmitter:Na+ symporter